MEVAAPDAAEFAAGCCCCCFDEDEEEEEGAALRSAEPRCSVSLSSENFGMLTFYKKNTAI